MKNDFFKNFSNGAFVEMHFLGIGIAYENKHDKDNPRINESKAIGEKGRDYLLNPKLKEKIQILRKKYDIPKKGFQSLRDLEIWYRGQNFFMNEKGFINYKKDATSLYQIVGERKRWGEFFEYFLLFDEVNPFIYNQKVSTAFRKNEEGEDEIILIVKDRVIQSDFHEPIKIAIEYSKELFGQKGVREKTMRERDAKILKLSLDGVDDEEIADRINKQMGEENMKYWIDEYYVKTLVKRTSDSTTRK